MGMNQRVSSVPGSWPGAGEEAVSRQSAVVGRFQLPWVEVQNGEVIEGDIPKLVKHSAT